jgi:hypothetical protein
VVAAPMTWMYLALVCQARAFNSFLVVAAPMKWIYLAPEIVWFELSLKHHSL